MKFSPSVSLAITFAGAATATKHENVHGHVARGEVPKLPYDPSTTSKCNYWWDNKDAFLSCENVPVVYDFSMADFLRWNPSIGADCSGYVVGKSYCISADEPVISSTSTSTSTTSTKSTPTPTPTPTSKTTLTTLTTITTTTTPGNGIATPTPIQPGMVSNCDLFYLVQKGDTCDSISLKSGISTSQFLAWNTNVGGATCTGLWADAYVCISIIGHTPSVPSTTKSAGNGIATPSPTQPDIVSNCDAFYLVKKGDTCDAIASKSGISTAEFLKWNPQAGSTCSGLWADAYACISVVGHTPTPTNPGNGVATPTPIQDGMVKNCKTFHKVVKGDTCATIAAKYKISSGDFIKWNPAAKSDCTGLWAETYACVGLL